MILFTVWVDPPRRWGRWSVSCTCGWSQKVRSLRLAQAVAGMHVVTTNHVDRSAT